jgi:uncharacterized protein YjbI with pentapeptide repeats
MSGHGLGVIVTALGIALATGFVFLILREQERKTERAPLALLIAFGWLVVPVWVVLFAGTLWQVWLILSGGDSSLVGAGRLGAGALLAALLGAPFVIWGTVLRQRNTEIQHRLADLNDAALFNDKISAASDSLTAQKQLSRTCGTGAQETILTEWQDDLIARASAIDRLEGLAQERPTEAPRIARMLLVYIRELSKAYPAKDRSEVDDGTKVYFHHWSEELKPERSDLEKAAQTLERLTKIHGIAREEIPVDLRGANLQGFDLRRLNFNDANLQNARMEGADLVETRIDGANLFGARLEGADLSKALMRRAKLSFSELEAADLRFAQIEGTDMSFAKLKDANLTGATLEGTNLTHANMESTNLSGAQMDSDTSLRFAIFQGAALRGVDYSDVGISADQVNSAFGDASVILPEEVDRPVHWPDWELKPEIFDAEWRKWLSDPDGYTPPPKPEG